MNNTRTVNYRVEANNYWLYMSDDDKVDFFIQQVLDGMMTVTEVEYILRHKPKLIKQFKKGIK